MSKRSRSLTWIHQALVAGAAVACAFSLLVAIGIVSNLMTTRVASPLNDAEMTSLRAALKANPADDALRNKIRDLDYMTRRFYFSGIASRQTGVALLLAGIAVALLSLRGIAVIRKRDPDPRHYAPRPGDLEIASASRWTLAGVVVAVFTAALYAAFTGRDLPAAENGTGGGGGEIRSSRRMAGAVHWCGFRGPHGDGVSPWTNAPSQWDGATGSNILWKTEVPLPGLGSPVVWENRVFVTGATDERREVYCFDIATGTRLWRMDVRPDPGHAKAVPEVDKETGFAASTPFASERGVCAVFANGDIAAFGFCAEPLWSADLGLPDNRYGHCASLLGYQDRIIVQYDQGSAKGKTAGLLAFEAATGKPVWSAPRTVGDSWPSPVLISTPGGPQIVTVANDAIIAYEPVSGRERWRVRCAGSDVAPSPVYAGGLVIASVTGDKVYGIRPDGTGDVTDTRVAWTSDEGIADVASPVSDGELVYLVSAAGMLTCLEVKTGKKVWDHSLDGEFYGSPGIAGNRLYLVARNGQVLIIRTGRAFEEIGRASLGEPSDGSPVFAGDRLLIRGLKTLFCIGAGTDR